MKNTLEGHCQEVADKYGWRFSRITTPAGKLDYYAFYKEDVSLFFHQRGLGGWVQLLVNGLECSIDSLFEKYYQGPDQLLPHQFAQRVLANFSRKKVLDHLQKQTEQRLEKSLEQLAAEEKLLRKIEQARNPLSRATAANLILGHLPTPF